MRLFIALLCACGLFAATNLSAEETPKLAAGEVVMKVNGIVCPACAYGIQKKVSKLSFVDTKKLHEGVELDVENHLAKVAIKAGQKPDFAALFEAVKKGGFDPVGGYALKGGKAVYIPASASKE